MVGASPVVVVGISTLIAIAIGIEIGNRNRSLGQKGQTHRRRLALGADLDTERQLVADANLAMTIDQFLEHLMEQPPNELDLFSSSPELTHTPTLRHPQGTHS